MSPHDWIMIAAVLGGAQAMMLAGFGLLWTLDKAVIIPVTFVGLWAVLGTIYAIVS